MKKISKIVKDIDWGSMTRNNQYKSAPSISKQQVAEHKPALARDVSDGKYVYKKTSNKK